MIAVKSSTITGHFDSVRDYLTVSQSAAHLEHYARQLDGRWILADVRGLNSTVTLESVNVTWPLAEIYFKAQLP